MEEKHYDIIVIGSGDAGKKVAGIAAEKGKKVALVEREEERISEKMLLSGAKIADAIRRMNDTGIRLGSGQVSWREMQSWKKKQSGEKFEKPEIDTYQGIARFIDEQSLTVNDLILHAKYIHIASGSLPKPLDVSGSEHVVLPDEFLNLEELPRRIIFIGGGYTSFELAHIAARCGCEVMILHRSEQVLKDFDPDLVALLVKASQEDGIIIKQNHPIVKVEKHGASYVVLTQEQGREIRENADLVVHGAGRIPDIFHLDLEKGSIAYSPKGITVNKYLQSVSNPRVFSSGDAADTGMMAGFVAIREGEIAAYNILHKTKQRYPDYTFAPSVVFSIPPLAKAGYTEKEAKEKGLLFDVQFKETVHWFSNRRANEKCAAYKLLIQKKTGRIIGAHVLGERADEMINLLSFAMQNKMTIEDLKKPVFAYPTATASIQDMI